MKQTMISSCFFFCFLSSLSVRAQQEPRIIGGEDAILGEFPYFVQVGLCGGSLIAPGVVLCAAHCWDEAIVGEFVTVGPIDPRGVTGNPRRSKITEKAYHPDFRSRTDEYDFMLLKLEEELRVNSPIDFTLNEDNMIPIDGQDLTIMGFGLLAENTYGWPDRLQKVVLQTVSFEECNATYGDIEDDLFICAGVPGGEKDSCQGDSGGPLVVKNGNRHVQVGLLSYGEGCGRPGKPGVYARVSAGQDWIKSIVCSCWKMTSALLCSSFDEQVTTAQVFECPYVPPPNCQNVPGYQDRVGDGCDWHEKNEYPGCEEYGDSTGGVGFEDTNAFESCCHCGGGIIPDPTVSPAPTPAFEINPFCEDMDGFIDIYSDPCSWYESNDDPDCIFYGITRGFGTANKDFTANDACCHCGGGIYPTSAPTPMPSPAPVTNSPTTMPAAESESSAAQAKPVYLGATMLVLALSTVFL